MMRDFTQPHWRMARAFLRIPIHMWQAFTMTWKYEKATSNFPLEQP